jgi:xanthine dehydrogenase accessory factor
MNEELFWKEVLNDIEIGTPVIVVVIIHREGSAPNVPGAKMLVTSETIIGTVGGGNSEHKLAELAKEMLSKGMDTVESLHLIHDDSATEYSSGMICSGSQKFALVPLFSEDKGNIKKIVEAYYQAKPGVLSISDKKISIEMGRYLEKDKIYTEEASFWLFQENIGMQNRIFICGGGHVSLALSKIMETLDFHITIFDDREDLPTMIANIYAHRKEIISFEEIEDYIPEGNNIYVAIMSFGHKSDEMILEKLIDKNFKYIGMMASPAKKKQLFVNLENKGISLKLLEKVHSPIGIKIKSDTPEEIAISIAAEIIKTKNS